MDYIIDVKFMKLSRSSSLYLVDFFHIIQRLDIKICYVIFRNYLKKKIGSYSLFRSSLIIN